MTKSTTTANETPTASSSPSHLREQLRQRNRNLFETIVARWDVDEDYFGNYLSVLEQYERDALALEMQIRGNDGEDVHGHMVRSTDDNEEDDEEEEEEVDDTLGTNDRRADVDGASNAPFSIGDGGRVAPVKTARGIEIDSSSNNDNNNDNDNHFPNNNNIVTNSFKEREEEGIEEKILLELRAQPYKFLDSKWKSFQPGVLRLSKVIIHNNPSTDTNENDDATTVVTTTSCQHRMVLRNSIGKVLLNLSVSKGMTFELVEMEKVGAKSGGFVRFMAVEKKEVGLETFMLKVKEGEVQSLYSTLMQMVE